MASECVDGREPSGSGRDRGGTGCQGFVASPGLMPMNQLSGRVSSGYRHHTPKQLPPQDRYSCCPPAEEAGWHAQVRRSRARACDSAHPPTMSSRLCPLEAGRYASSLLGVRKFNPSRVEEWMGWLVVGGRRCACRPATTVSGLRPEANAAFRAEGSRNANRGVRKWDARDRGARPTRRCADSEDTRRASFVGIVLAPLRGDPALLTELAVTHISTV